MWAQPYLPSCADSSYSENWHNPGGLNRETVKLRSCWSWGGNLAVEISPSWKPKKGAKLESLEGYTLYLLFQQSWFTWKQIPFTKWWAFLQSLPGPLNLTSNPHLPARSLFWVLSQVDVSPRIPSASSPWFHRCTCHWLHRCKKQMQFAIDHLAQLLTWRNTGKTCRFIYLCFWMRKVPGGPLKLDIFRQRKGRNILAGS